MADGRVSEAMKDNLLINISKDIDILLEDDEVKDESNEHFIDRKLTEMHFKRMKNELMYDLKEFVRSEVAKIADSLRIERDFFCPAETRKFDDNGIFNKSQNDRIAFLEEEIRFKNLLLNKLVPNSNSIKCEKSNFPTQQDIFNSSNTILENTLSNKVINEQIYCIPKKTLKINKSDCVNVTNFTHENKFDSLPIENINENRKSIHNDEKNNNRSTKNRRHRENKNKKKSIQIIGDSIIKEIKGWKLSDDNSNVIVKTFPGASTKCMQSYVKPTTEKNPDVIILHCGTNDLRSKSTPEEISSKIIDLALSLNKDKI